MEEPEWMTVLRVFWEENLSFEYSGRHDEYLSFIPDRSDLENVDVPRHIEDLLKAGYLEVKTVNLEHDDSVPFNNMSVIRISEKGLKAVFEWEVTVSQNQWERRLLETQEEYERDRLERQQTFEEKQATKANEVNSAIGYLTTGLLVVTLSDILLNSQDFIPDKAILLAVGAAVAILVVMITTSGLLNPSSVASE